MPIRPIPVFVRSFFVVSRRTALPVFGYLDSNGSVRNPARESSPPCGREKYPANASPQEAVGWMENLCRAFSNNPKEAEQALMDFRKSEHAVEVSKIILGKRPTIYHHEY